MSSLLGSTPAEAWRSDHRGQVSYEFQYAFAKFFAQFTLARPVEEATRIGVLWRNSVDQCPKYLGVLLEALPAEEDRVRSGEVFWGIWNSVSAPIFEHHLLRGSSRIWRHDEVRMFLWDFGRQSAHPLWQDRVTPSPLWDLFAQLSLSSTAWAVDEALLAMAILGLRSPWSPIEAKQFQSPTAGIPLA